MCSIRSLSLGLAALAVIGLAASVGAAAKADKKVADGTTGVIVAIDKKADKSGTITIRMSGGRKKDANVAGPEKKFTITKDTKVERTKRGKDSRAADLGDLQKDLTVHIQANGDVATVISIEESRSK